MTFQEFEKLFGKVDVDEMTRFALDYLERHGSRFLVDHGYENAKDKAADLAIMRLAMDPMDPMQAHQRNESRRS